MCGKFTQMASWREVYEYANLMGAKPNDEVKTFTPMWTVPVVHLGHDGERLVTPMVWGFTDRKPEGRRVPKNMHARGETVESKPSWADAFRSRRGLTWAKSFNLGKELPVIDDEGNPTLKTWTQQWKITPKDGKPIILAVIYDEFDVGKGPEFEYAQLTMPANQILSAITDRMPVLLREEDVELWLGELRAPLGEIRSLVRTVEFNEVEWQIGPEDPNKKPPRPKARKKSVVDKPRLF